MISLSRDLAFRILIEVENGAFAADLLAVRATALSSRDAGLATALALGVLRHRAQLDYAIETLTAKPVLKLDTEIRQALRMGIFQLRYMDRIPPHAAVSESVELVKKSGKRSAAGLVNAILRKVAQGSTAWPDRATRLSCPEWLLGRWTLAFGTETAEAIAAAALTPPVRYIRLPAGSPLPEGAAVTDVPGCFALPPETLVPAGARVQDIGSQSIPPLLDLQPGYKVLDLCAAPGNKTCQLREVSAFTVAADISFRRLQSLDAPKLVLDAREALPFPALFDRILVDAPCSGTGTIAHNPEIKWHLREAEIARHRDRQFLILKNALAVLKPGGLLVYSTCSLEPEENEHVVERVAPNRSIQTIRRIPGRDAGDGFFAAVLR